MQLRKLWTLPIAIAILVSGIAAQSDSKPTASQISARIADLIRETLRASEGVTPEGIRVTRPPRPSKAAVEEMRRYGKEGVVALSQMLPFQSSRECATSMRLIASLEPDSVIGPLLAAVEDQNIVVGCRLTALNLLRDAPSEVLMPLLERSAVSDSHADVRQAAREMIDMRRKQAK